MIYLNGAFARTSKNDTKCGETLARENLNLGSTVSERSCLVTVVEEGAGW
jgi:hypothetical protein